MSGDLSAAVGKKGYEGGDSALTPIRPQWRITVLARQYHGEYRRQGILRIRTSTLSERVVLGCMLPLTGRLSTIVGLLDV